jgi:hypothetical protein
MAGRCQCTEPPCREAQAAAAAVREARERQQQQAQHVLGDSASSAALWLWWLISRLPYSMPTYAGSYVLFCLLPATSAALALVAFYFGAVGLDVGVATALAVLVSTSSMVHWVLQPRR